MTDFIIFRAYPKLYTQRRIIVATLIFICVSQVIIPMAAGISILPNSSAVHAVVKEKEVIPDENGQKSLSNVTFYVISAGDYNGMPNFMKENEGKNITSLMLQEEANSISLEEEVDLIVSVVGDERGEFYKATLKR